jgi:hypothetical protein
MSTKHSNLVKGLTVKERQALAVLHDYPEWKVLEKWSNLKALQVTGQIVGVDMSEQGSDKRVAMLQGQILAHGNMLKEINKIAKTTSVDD